MQLFAWFGWIPRRSCRIEQVSKVYLNKQNPTLGLALRVPKAFPSLSPSLLLLEVGASTFPKHDFSKDATWEGKAHFLLAIYSCNHNRNRLTFHWPNISPFNIINNNFCCQSPFKSNAKSYSQRNVLVTHSHFLIRDSYNQNLHKSTINSFPMPFVLKISVDM